MSFTLVLSQITLISSELDRNFKVLPSQEKKEDDDAKSADNTTDSLAHTPGFKLSDTHTHVRRHWQLSFQSPVWHLNMCDNDAVWQCDVCAWTLLKCVGVPGSEEKIVVCVCVCVCMAACG